MCFIYYFSTTGYNWFPNNLMIEEIQSWTPLGCIYSGNLYGDHSVNLFAIKTTFWRTLRKNLRKMLKSIVFLTLLAACLALPLDETPAVNSETQLVDPKEITPPQAVAEPAAEVKEEGDLKTDPTFWFSYGYPYRRRSFYSSYYSPYSYSYYRYPSYWSPYSYYW